MSGDTHRKYVETVIDGFKVECSKFTGREGGHIGRKLLGLLASGGKDSNPIEAMGKLSDAEWDALSNRILAGTQINGKAATLALDDDTLQGRLDIVVLVLKWVVEVNMTSFFAGPLGEPLRKVFAAVRSKVEAELAQRTESSSTSPPTSGTSTRTGSTGDSGAKAE